MQRIMYFMSLICLYMFSLASHNITADTMEVSPKYFIFQKSECSNIRCRRGMRGSPGKRGVRGERGAPGRIGDLGKPGTIGDRGQRGTRGERGKPGKRGRPGPEGKPGDKGDPGLIGEHGFSGSRGPRGDTGKNGPDSHGGRRGARGDRGHKGSFGQRGKRGETTNIVLSAFSSALISIPATGITSVNNGANIGSVNSTPVTPYNIISNSNITIDNSTGIFTSSAGAGVYQVNFGVRGSSVSTNVPGLVQLFVDGNPINATNNAGEIKIGTNGGEILADWSNDSVIVQSTSSAPTFALKVNTRVFLGDNSPVSADAVYITIVKLA